MNEVPYAAALTHIPATGETFYTPFSGAHHDDPMSAAIAFRESEEERGDFPGSLWAIAANDAAREIRSARLLASLGLAAEEPS